MNWNEIRSDYCTTKHLEGELHKSEVLLSTRTMLVINAKNIYWKMHKQDAQTLKIEVILWMASKSLFLVMKYAVAAPPIW